MVEENESKPEGRETKNTTLVMAFQGWSDAGDAASMAVDHIRRQTRAKRVETIDSDDFFDFTVVRPVVHIDETGVRQLTWPETKFYLTPSNDDGDDVLYCVGIEPQLRWKTFARSILATAASYGVQKVVSLGALASEVSHNRHVRVIGTTSDSALGSSLNMQPSRYEGPTGILGVLQGAFQRQQIPSVSLWANVPHYVAQTPSPKAALALVRRVALLLERDFDTTSLENAAMDYVNQIDELVAADDEIRSYIDQLEDQEDSDETTLPPDDEIDSTTPLTLASGDELASEAENFLREHGRSE
jgi:predicted ATP-grasp superfamily ATP-dependent carboligase